MRGRKLEKTYWLWNAGQVSTASVLLNSWRSEHVHPHTHWSLWNGQIDLNELFRLLETEAFSSKALRWFSGLALASGFSSPPTSTLQSRQPLRTQQTE